MLADLKKYFSVKLGKKFTTEQVSKMPSNLKRIAELPYETLSSAYYKVG